MKKLIAFTGPMGSGKSTAIEALKEEYDKTPVVLVKFAAPLYDMQEYIYRRIASVHTRPADFVKDRFLLQFIGTDWGRDKISKTIWGDIWQQEVDQELLVGNLVVCDDVRFDNEAERVKSLGGVIIKLETKQNLERINTNTGIQNHTSEAGVSEPLVDYTIINNGSLAEFKNKLVVIYKKLLDKPE